MSLVKSWLEQISNFSPDLETKASNLPANSWVVELMLFFKTFSTVPLLLCFIKGLAHQALQRRGAQSWVSTDSKGNGKFGVMKD